MTIYQTVLGPGLLDIGEMGSLTSFASQVTKCTLTPKHNEEDDVPVLSGETAAGDLTTSWTLTGEMFQDFGNPDATKSLSEWTITNNGKSYPFTFTPNNGGNKSVTGTVQVRATAVGGDVNKSNRSDFEFKVIGQPTITATTP